VPLRTLFNLMAKITNKNQKSKSFASQCPSAMNQQGFPDSWPDRSIAKIRANIDAIS
jgi:hypothetical protein